MSFTARTQRGSAAPAAPMQLRSRRNAVTVAAVLAGALGLLALGPGLARGFLLSYDMVFVPGPPFSAALAGVQGPPRAVPSDAFITVAARLLPSDIVQKLVLLLIFIGACTGAAVLLSAGWRALYGHSPPVLACLVSGTFYAWNPFTAERLLIGQWAMLLGYAGLPWVLGELVTRSAGVRPWRLGLAMLPAAIGGFAAMMITVLAAVPAALASGAGGWRERARRTLTVVAAFALLSLPWVVPALLNPVHTDPRGVEAFAARADTPFGGLGSLVLLSGIWNAQTVPRGYGGAASYIWLLVVACALAGYLLVAKRNRVWRGLGAAGLTGLAVAAVGTFPVTRVALRALVTAWPGFAVLRDGQQYVAAFALTEAIGLGAGVAWLLGRTVRADNRRTRTQPPAVAIAIMAVLAPLLLLPGMAWGLGGRIRPVQYPADWLAARQVIDTSSRPGSVLVLPWAAYRRYPWNHGEAVYDPWNKLLSREVIANDGVEVGRLTLSQESPSSIEMTRTLSRPGVLTSRLAAAGVTFVIIDTGPLLAAQPVDASVLARLPGARVVQSSRDLIVLELPGR
jgi:hypothetical protein